MNDRSVRGQIEPDAAYEDEPPEHDPGHRIEMVVMIPTLVRTTDPQILDEAVRGNADLEEERSQGFFRDPKQIECACGEQFRNVDEAKFHLEESC